MKTACHSRRLARSAGSAWLCVRCPSRSKVIPQLCEISRHGFSMPSFHLHSTKYDGSLHYRYAVEPLHRSETQLITLCTPGAAVQSYRGQWATSKTLLSFFWKAQPWVLHVCWQNDWQPEWLYVDISTATSWD